jgi:hypothetical protein
MKLESTALPASGARFALLPVLSLFLLAVVLLAPGAARAQDDVVYGGHDWYMSALGMLGVESNDATGASPSGGATLIGGFRFNRWLAAEVGGEWARRFHYEQGSGPITCRGEGGGESNRFNAWQVSAGGRAYATESLVQPFLMAHGGFIQTRDSGGGRSCMGTGFMTRLGGGVEVFVTNGMAVSLLGAYVLPLSGKARDHDYVSIGLGLIWY